MVANVLLVSILSPAEISIQINHDYSNIKHILFIICVRGEYFSLSAQNGSFNVSGNVQVRYS